MSKEKPRVEGPAGAEILLHAHMRILLQPLRDDPVHNTDGFQIADDELGRLCDRRLCFGVDCKCVYESLCVPQNGLEKGTDRSQYPGEGI